MTNTRFKVFTRPRAREVAK